MNVHIDTVSILKGTQLFFFFFLTRVIFLQFYLSKVQSNVCQVK